jgi:hypothetical protein
LSAKTGVSAEVPVSWDEGLFNSYTGAKGGIGIGHSGDNRHTGRGISEMVTADPGDKIELTVTKVEGFAFDTTKFPRKSFHVVIPQKRLEKNFEFTVPTTLPSQVA